MNAILIWRATQWFVGVSIDGHVVAELPFDDFVKLPAVKYAIALALERSDLGTAPEELQQASAKAVSLSPE